MRVKFHLFCSLLNVQPLKECFVRVHTQILAERMNRWLGVTQEYYFRMSDAQCNKILNSGLFLKIQQGNIHSTMKGKSNIIKITKGA